jgi:hypothetical protein
VVKAAGAPLLWLLVYLMRGLSIVGLGMCAVALPDRRDTPDTAGAPPVSMAELSHDERLWEDELAADDAGAC